MAGLLGDTTTSTRERLGTLVYDDPETGNSSPPPPTSPAASPARSTPPRSRLR
jgi:hypothetical protein